MSEPIHILPLSFDAIAWERAHQGHYHFVDDPRGLCQVFHPWEASATGDFASLTASVSVPEDWEGPLFLSFYAGDNYVADGWEETRKQWLGEVSYHAGQHLPGHRFKEVLVDGQIVWEHDVGDPEDPAYFHVELPRGHDQIQVCLRVSDRVGTAQPLPSDELHLGVWSWQAQRDERPDRKLYTRVIWGDVALSCGAPVSAEDNTARPPILLAPITEPGSQPVSRARGCLRLDAPAGVPGDGYPVTWGIPFGRGELQDSQRVRVSAPDGSPVPLQTTVLRRWPDGNVHWLLLDFSAAPQTAGELYEIEYGSEVEPVPASAGLQVVDRPDGIAIDTGAIQVTVPRGSRDLLRDVRVGADQPPLVDRLVGSLSTRDGWITTAFTAQVDRLYLEAAGPERACVLAEGELRGDGETFGRFTCRLHAYRGREYLRVFFRVFNDTDCPAQLVTSLELRLDTALEEGTAVLGEHRMPTDATDTRRLLVRQHAADGFEVFRGDDTRVGSGTAWSGPVTLTGAAGAVAGQVRHFAQQYPKRMWAGSGGQLVFELFAVTREYEQYIMPRGEAKRHELLLWFGTQAPDPGLFATFEAPPALLSPEWYAEHQAFGRAVALTDDVHPELLSWMTRIGVPSLECTVPMGLRNWPDGYSDSIHSAYRGTWGNMYQEVDYGAYIMALLAGQRDFLDYAEAYQRHFMDMDVCHHHRDPKLVGAAFGIAPNHSGSQPYELNAPLAGLFLLHYLTGDPDARQTAMGIADWLHATQLGVGAGSGRAVGWPLRSATIAYECIGDAKHLESARQLAEYALDSLNPRLGYFSQPLATWHYRGGGVGYNTILAAGLMRYWRASGDERVGRACAQIAYNVAYSWMSPLEPGLLYNSDPVQQISITGYAMQDVVPLFWGYELTGDRRFLEKGVQVMEASILDEAHQGMAFGLSRYWEMQDILYYFRLAREMDGGDQAGS